MSSSGGSSDAPKLRSAAQQSTEVLHQRRGMPLGPAAMAVGGFLIVAGIGYLTLYSKSKPGTTRSEAAKVAANTDDGVEAAGRPSK